MSKLIVGVTKAPHETWLGEKCCEEVVYCTDQVSVAHDKNVLIKHFMDSDTEYLVLFDHDCFPIKEGWEQFFIDGCLKTGIQHFVLCDPVHSLYDKGDETVSCYLTGTGCMLFLTRKVIETVGYINPAYGKYGYEHVAYSHRIRMAGLTPAWYVSLNGWEEYIYAWDLDQDGAEQHGFVKEHFIDKQQKEAYIKQNEKIFNKEVLGSQLYYGYDTSIESTD